MFVSVQAKLVFLAMPKCASSSIEIAASKHIDISFRRPPRAKHMTYRRFNQFIRPWLTQMGVKDVETICLFREPLDWCESYWRYRQRPEMNGHVNSTADIPFDRFLNIYMDGRARPANIGVPSRFVSDARGGTGVDKIYRFDRLDACFSYICERLEVKQTLDKKNVSPRTKRERATVAPETMARFRDHMARDYEIYETVAL